VSQLSLTQCSHCSDSVQQQFNAFEVHSELVSSHFRSNRLVKANTMRLHPSLILTSVIYQIQLNSSAQQQSRVCFWPDSCSICVVLKTTIFHFVLSLIRIFVSDLSSPVRLFLLEFLEEFCVWAWM